MTKKARNNSGFTLIELAVVVAIFGITMTMLIVKADSVIPRAQLNTSSRYVGSCVEIAMANAAMKGEERVVLYDIRNGIVSVGRILSGKETPEILSRKVFPPEVKIAGVVGAETDGDGVVTIIVSQSGRTPPHSVYLKRGDDEMTVAVRGITGLISYLNGHVDPDTPDALSEEEL